MPNGRVRVLCSNNKHVPWNNSPVFGVISPATRLGVQFLERLDREARGKKGAEKLGEGQVAGADLRLQAGRPSGPTPLDAVRPYPGRITTSESSRSLVLLTNGPMKHGWVPR